MGDVPDLVDVIVIGFGGAGVAAALRAHELGSSVVIVEKQPRRRHTPSTRMSGGLVMAVNDAVAATEYLDRCAGAMTPRDVSAAWAHRAGDLLAWLTEHTGLTFDKVNGAEHPEFDGADSIGVYQSGGATFRLDPRPIQPRSISRELSALQSYNPTRTAPMCDNVSGPASRRVSSKNQ